MYIFRLTNIEQDWGQNIVDKILDWNIGCIPDCVTLDKLLLYKFIHTFVIVQLLSRV